MYSPLKSDLYRPTVSTQVSDLGYMSTLSPQRQTAVLPQSPLVHQAPLITPAPLMTQTTPYMTTLVLATQPLVQQPTVSMLPTSTILPSTITQQPITTPLVATTTPLMSTQSSLPVQTEMGKVKTFVRAPYGDFLHQDLTGYSWQGDYVDIPVQSYVRDVLLIPVDYQIIPISSRKIDQSSPEYRNYVQGY